MIHHYPSISLSHVVQCSTTMYLYTLLIFLSFHLFFLTDDSLHYLSAQSVNLTSVNYTYDTSSPNGPTNWYRISNIDASLCRSGTQQSPIDIVTVLNTQQQSIASIGFGTGLSSTSQLVTLTTPFTPVTLMYPTSSSSSPSQPQLQLVNNGATLIGNIQSKDIISNEIPRLMYKDYIYTTENILFHSPSEHTLNSAYGDMEIQFIMKRLDNNTMSTTNHTIPQNLIWSAFLVLPQSASSSNAVGENDFLKQLGFTNDTSGGAQLPKNSGDQRNVPLNTIDFSKVVYSANASYFQYDGSLSVPPCTESYVWFIQQFPLTLSLPQKLAFTNTFGVSTNRPLQSVNGRTIQYEAQPAYNPVVQMYDPSTDQMIATILLTLVGVLSFGLFISRDIKGYWYYTKHAWLWLIHSLRPTSYEDEFQNGRPEDAYRQSYSDGERDSGPDRDMQREREIDRNGDRGNIRGEENDMRGGGSSESGDGSMSGGPSGAALGMNALGERERGEKGRLQHRAGRASIADEAAL